jgi:hypothetical protein
VRIRLNDLMTRSITSAALLIGASSALAVLPGSPAGPRARDPLGPSYTAATAPDLLSREILTAKLYKLDQTASGGSVGGPEAIHRNFPQLIEQGLAAMNPAQKSRFMANVQDRELSDLAQLYVNATADMGVQGRLLDLMAIRMTGTELGRMSMHFGFEPVRAAVMRSAPEKAIEFQMHSSRLYAAPMAGETLFWMQGAMPAITSGSRRADGVGDFLFYTLPEIYLSFRTAPVGALGVFGSLYETVAMVDGPLGRAFGYGYLFGSAVVAPLIQRYAPTLWDDIGGTINQIIENLQQVPSGPPAAPVEKNTAEIFQCPVPVENALDSTGGDFGVVSDWADYGGGGGGGGGGGRCEYCVLD